VHFYTPCTLAALLGEFGHANRILCLKVSVPVYKGEKLSKCQGYLVVTYLFYGRLRLLVIPGTGRNIFCPYSEDTHTIFRVDIPMRPKLNRSLLAVFTLTHLFL